MAHFIGSPCVDVLDQSCVDVCPVDCIYEGDRKMYINPTECIDCGACIPACPVSAIEVDRKTADDDVHLLDNASFFYDALPGAHEALGDPGGADEYGVVGVDTKLVASLPPNAEA